MTVIKKLNLPWGKSCSYIFFEFLKYHKSIFKIGRNLLAQFSEGNYHCMADRFTGLDTSKYVADVYVISM